MALITMYQVVLCVFVCVVCVQARDCYQDEIQIESSTVCYTNKTLAYNRTFEFSWRYNLVDMDLDNATIQTMLYTRLALINSVYKTILESVSRSLCNQDDCYDVDIKVKVQGSGYVDVSIKAANRRKNFPHEFAKTEVSIEEYWEKGNFSLEGLDTVSGSYYHTKQVYCKPGTAEVASEPNYCYMCGSGYYDNGNNCNPCAKGGYQPYPGKTECVPCDEGLTTYDISSTQESQCLEFCGPGYKINLATRHCEVCGYSFYQTRPGQTYCLECQAGSTTYANNTGEADECYFLCKAGEQMNERGDCEPCEVGYYRSNFGTFERWCVSCDYGFTTKHDGSTSRDDCNRVLCFAGSYRLGDDPGTCTLCPIGTYKSDAMENCTQCGDPNYWRTDMEGATSSTACKSYCPAGFYISDNQCMACPQDTFKLATSFYSTSCTQCPDNTKTGGTEATSPDDCRYAMCSRGQQIHPDDTLLCQDCDYGSYQDQDMPIHVQCQQCMPRTSTRVTKATSVIQCEDYCEDGNEMTDSSNCVPCQRGYYKDNTLSPIVKFNKCTLCPADKTTVSEGATRMTDCNIANCGAGSYVSEANTCVECPKGSYQDTRWQTSCVECPDSESTTAGTGSTSISQCNLYPNRTTVLFKLKLSIDWNDALWDINSRQYIKLKDRIITQVDHALSGIISYRNGLRLLAMVPGSIDIHMSAWFNKEDVGFFQKVNALLRTHIDMGYISSETVDNMAPLPIDSTSNAVLDIMIKDVELTGDCPNGQFYAYNFNTCEDCPQSWYQPPYITNVCVECPAGTETLGTGNHGDVGTVCKLKCPAGQEATTGQCEPCEMGRYKPDTSSANCSPCGSGFTTQSRGAVSSNMCYAACGLGSYSDDSNTCRRCPFNTYNDKGDVTVCESCPAGKTTDSIGSTSAELCIGPCERLYATYCQNGGSCVDKGTTAECRCTEGYEGDNCGAKAVVGGFGQEELITYSAIGAGGLVLIIVVVCVCVCCCRARRSSDKSSSSSNRSSTNSNSHADVDRLHSNSTVSSDVPVYGRLPLVQTQFDGNSLKSTRSSYTNGVMNGGVMNGGVMSGGVMNGGFMMENPYGTTPRAGSAVFQAVPSFTSQTSIDSGSTLPPYPTDEPLSNQRILYRDLSRTNAPSQRSTDTLRSLPGDTVPPEVRRSNLKKSKKSKSKKENKTVTFAKKKKVPTATLR